MFAKKCGYLRDFNTLLTDDTISDFNIKQKGKKNENQ